jgi:formiminotetrahydrofolate cyclodeaminase
VNKARRKVLDQITAELTDIQTRLEAARDEEQEAFDAMPEGLANSERGERAQAAAETLETACDGLTDLLTSIDEALQS